MEDKIYTETFTQDNGWVDIMLIAPPPDGVKGFAHLKNTLGTVENAAELYKKSKSLPCILVEKIYFGTAERLVSMLKNSEIVEIVKRTDSIVTTTYERRIPAAALQVPALPKELTELIKLDITFNYILTLPARYADVDDFLKMQDGYRYSCVTGEFLVGAEKGDWLGDWYVFGQNYFDDPFFIDFSQANLGFPVYFAYHGGIICQEIDWQPIKIADNLEHFTQILRVLKIRDAEIAFEIGELDLGVDTENEFWAEVAEICRNFGQFKYGRLD